MARRINRWRLVYLLCPLAVCAAWSTFAAAQSRQQISPGDFSRVVAEFLATSDRQQDEIISQRDVLPLITALEARGMKLDRKELLKRIPPDNSGLVKLLRTPNGRKFITQTSSNRLMFDRLDRLMDERGGERMLHDLMKLPDAARYAKLKPQRGLPGLVDFLPKARSGKTRRVKDYQKPTGMLYTVADVIDDLAAKLDETPKARRDG